MATKEYLDKEKEKELRYTNLLDAYINKLYQGAYYSNRQILLTTLSDGPVGSEGFQEGRKIIEGLETQGYVNVTWTSNPSISLNKSGERFVGLGYTFKKEREKYIKEKRWDGIKRFFAWFGSLQHIINVLASIATIASAYLAYIAIQQNKDIDELKTRIEKLEKVNLNKEIENKFKLPTIK